MRVYEEDYVPPENGAEERKGEKSFIRLPTVNKVAIKVLAKNKILESNEGVSQLLTEIKTHWALEQCEGVLKLIQLFECPEYMVLVLEY